MPYKDPERKRQWEREHREQRNAGRRMQHITARSGQQSVSKPAPDPVSDQESQLTWKTILGWAIGIGVVLLAAIGGVNPPASTLARRYS
jgi:ferric-dicitrate binding protein FerR (iron transport regulator)